jgi:hypothetical protein
MGLSRKEAEHVFQALRGGTVPEQGIEAFAVGIDPQRRELTRMLDLVSDGNGEVKFLRGGYGCGKTFMSNLALHDAQGKNFVTSFVVVSDNDLHFHKFDELYRKVVQGLSTTACARGALGDILDRWIGRIYEDLFNLGVEDDADFDAQVRAKLNEKLTLLTGGEAPPDMVRVLGAIFDAKLERKLTEANSLISWLSGSTNVAQSEKKIAGVRGDIGSTDAMAYLRGILEIIKSAGYAGLVIVIDEAETILRMRGDVRQKSLNGIRQICDDAKNYPGLLWLFTGTPAFFDDRRGVKGLEALNDRIAFDDGGGFPSLRQPQLALKPFDRDRLTKVALKLRGLHPDADSDQLEARVHNGVVEKLVDNVTHGFKGDVGVVPRHFLRQFVNMLDQVVQYEEYNPEEHVGFVAGNLSPEEERSLKGEPEEASFGGAEMDF